MQGLRQLSTFIGQTFALWAIVFAIAGFTAPQVFTPFKPAIPYAIGIIMFGMGLTLRARDFAEILRRPFQVLLASSRSFSSCRCLPSFWYTSSALSRWSPLASSSSAAAPAARRATS
nr:hypothetical protein [Cardiobacterium hominis]